MQEVIQEKTTEELVKWWEEAKRLKGEADRAANSASCRLANATNELGKRLCPEGVKLQDVKVFHVWSGDRLFAVTRFQGDFRIEEVQVKR